MTPDFTFVETNGVRLRVAVAGAGPLILMAHGFPESWYSWRHQFEPLSALGFTVAAPDIRGYGGSDRPDVVEAYDLDSMVGDLAGLIDTLGGGEPAILIGHDHGAPMVWQTALRHPERVRAVAGLSVPHTPPGDRPFIEIYTEAFTAKGRFFYQACFQEEGVAEAELEADPAASIRRFYYALAGDAPDGTWPKDKVHGDALLHRLPEPDMPLPWLSEADVAYLAGEFAQSGFRGPVNRYRNSRRDFAYQKQLDDFRIHQPSLFIGGTRDLVLKMSRGDMVADMLGLLTDCRGSHLLEGCGHWTQQERPDAVNRLLVEWLRGL